MFLSRSCEYAIRAAVYAAHAIRNGKRAGIVGIADAIGSPMHFTAKILQTLSRKKLLASAKGPAGGFYLEEDRLLFLTDIIRAVDGEELSPDARWDSGSARTPNHARCITRPSRSGIGSLRNSVERRSMKWSRSSKETGTS